MKNLQLLFLLFIVNNAFAQKVLTLQQTIDLAQLNSNYVQIANQKLEIQRADFKAFSTELKPQLELKGSPASYSKNYNPITQPDGGIIYQPVEQNNVSMQLNLTQQVAATGGAFFVGSQLNRYDDFQNSFHQYQAQPLYIGYSQPIFKYNELKWSKKLAPLQLQEAEKQFIEDMEFIAVQATQYYFEVLSAQWNANIAQQNVTDNKKIERITKEKLLLGKASESEVLQIELNVISAEQTFASAVLNYRSAMRTLINYLQIDASVEDNITLIVPSEFQLESVDTQIAWNKAQGNRKDFITFHKKLVDGQRLIEQAKRENRFQANIDVAFGVSNQSEQIGNAYQNTIQSQRVNVTLAVPILDWGRAKAKIHSANQNYKLTQNQIAQDKLDFHREVINASEQLETMAKQVKFIKRADEVAQKKYSIALQRYELGDLSIRELVWSTDEKDQAKNAYLNTLKSYWISYFQLRTITLYDFENETNIKYTIN
ncbi:TolC family protein [Flammeovirga kamogawensis]|uniref:TolC family protein n=1 Tax=Flammeovirga kamogawensis TaxID=373891 RepID=A0ABX8H2Z6_9BACT|nr:TolC family protein [Flammeovirga kamogawensis]MBB6460482.1 outer membrane protein TolC [Flammeovirga kamogawensis]QWG10288.1 TolC family protein [Flammeovirga kamogawensis]TRX64736.1 TolC family protein [Flammeovirga kamogawensis]